MRVPLLLILLLAGVLAAPASAQAASFEVSSPTVTEGNSGTTDLQFTVTLKDAPTATPTFTLEDVTTSAADHGSPSPSSAALVQDVPTTVTVPVNGDTIDELSPETFKLKANDAVLGISGEGTGSITDDDDPPTVSVADAGNVAESAGNASFKISLSAASGQDVTVSYATADGSAKQPGDYSSTSGSVTFSPGEVEKTVQVPVVNDTIDEPNQDFTLGLSNPQKATIADGSGTATITDDDNPPSISVNNATVNEAAGSANFTVSLSAESEQTVTVSYATADGSAKQPGDYTSTSGSLSFSPGDPPETVSVPVNDDNVDELDENFTLGLSNPQNATIADGSGTGTIQDNDGGPTVTAVDSPNVVEGASGTTPATFKVRLSQPSEQVVSLTYATANGTATAPPDYAARSGTVTFQARDVEEDVSVPVNGDPMLEPNEQFRLTLGDSAQNASVAAGEEAQATILNDDLANRPPTASFFANPPDAFVAKGVLLDGRGSSDPEGRALSFAWDIDGNGSYETSTGSDALVLTAFCTPGAQRLGLKVTDPGSASDGTRRSDTTSRTVNVVQASPDNSCDQVPPAVQIARINRSLRRALRRNLAVRLRCSEACTMVASAGVDRRTGRRLGLRGRRRTLGKASGSLITAGSKRLRIKFSRIARRKLRRARRVRVTLRFTVKDAALNELTLRRTIVLRR